MSLVFFTRICFIRDLYQIKVPIYKLRVKLQLTTNKHLKLPSQLLACQFCFIYANSGNFNFYHVLTSSFWLLYGHFSIFALELHHFLGLKLFYLFKIELLGKDHF